MGYRIDASLYQGRPKLTITDINTNEVFLEWQYENEGTENPDKNEIQRLFKALFLLSYQQKENL